MRGRLLVAAAKVVLWWMTACGSGLKVLKGDGPGSVCPIVLKQPRLMLLQTGGVWGAKLALPRLCAKSRKLTPRAGFLEALSRVSDAPGPSAVLCTEMRESTACDRAVRLQRSDSFPEKRFDVVRFA